MIKRPVKYQDFEDPQARPRYTGIATFFRAPQSQQLEEADIGIIGVPFDGGVTNRSGARHGPRAVREQSTLLRRINSATGVTPFAGARVQDLGDCWIEQPYELIGSCGQWPRTVRSAWCTSTRTATPVTTIWGRASTMVLRFDARWRRIFWIRNV
jgi:arginase family enzyme